MHVAGSWLSGRDGEAKWFIAMDILTGIILVALYVAFWKQEWKMPLPLISKGLFILAMVWEGVSTPHDLRVAWQDDECSTGEKLGLIIFAIVAVIPMFILAGVSAFKGT